MENNISYDALLTLKEATAYLKLSRSTLYKLMENGEIKGIKIGKVWRFQRKELDNFIAKKANNQ